MEEAAMNPSGPQVWRPGSLQEALELKRELGSSAVLVAGGTLLRTQWESGLRSVSPHFISLEGIPELTDRVVLEEGVFLGSLVTLSVCRKEAFCPLLAESCRTIAAPSIRRLATLGGNVLSRVGDALPALLVRDARLHWWGPGGEEVEELADWLERQKPGVGGLIPFAEERILAGVELPRSEMPFEERLEGEAVERNKAGSSAEWSFYHKIGRREAFVPSLVTAAFAAELDRGGRVRRVRLAVGGGSSLPQRLVRTEAKLEGEALTAGMAETVAASVMDEWGGFDDPWGAASYRRMTAANLFAAGWWSKAMEREGIS